MKKTALAIAVLLALANLFVITELFGWRNDPLYLFYYSEIKKDEEKLKLYADQLCNKLTNSINSLKCRKYKFKVVVFHPVLYWDKTVADGNLLTHVGRVRKIAIDNLNEDEIKFILAHELAHYLFNTLNEDMANRFATEMTSAETKHSVFKKMCQMLHIQPIDCVS
ncbi:hypothetical protein A2926_02725 [Candidatus Giovannonibacteria bacterium RIFCSPLOWO2_01_FULL_44_40]|uniref:Peptidase M48 domain-containing protein n=1 Tax=Candidatus Giovannonibacteria bacterium RIFCSPHIGHO2_01_FULL_45_23 TaxID=1798325 RepID=A0A1F5VE99_9BACT|nr:MAG: hypothetical protein A2834_00850 [Candidatus Giovannonibacteria bacterium RIFCSPHIGHO2_01_FULL_45_23]OGF75253.1 MAG: hypothetical protein A3C77_02655 [Candidatus Giovannonibacteria bacterium RIFCSPHIGHO2_02_FULL_45_13]OGF79927.1 MAG: hypothetical protein A2926_02725 [Candidatus Giovannonibacteria bacterium RIFCSPLOWO2_01_FULL_44_40]